MRSPLAAPARKRKSVPRKKTILPWTVEGALRSFARKHVDLSTADVAQARRSRDFLIQRLKGLTGREDVPRLTGAILPFGSFARRTKIRPLDDIDLLVVVRGTGLKLSGFRRNDDLQLMPPPGSWPDRYLTKDGFLNSRVVLNGLKAHATGIVQYRTSPKKCTGQAMVLQPTTKPWVFDLVPAVAVRDPQKKVTHYLIPNGRGGWMATDPRRDALNTRNASAQVAGEMYAIVRLVKYWNRRGGKPRLGSYHLEVMAMEALTRQPFLEADPLGMLETCLTYISSRVYYHYPDPKGLEGPIDRSLSDAARQKIAVAARTAADHLRQAARLHASSPREAHALLQRVFGKEFPRWTAKEQASMPVHLPSLTPERRKR